MPSAREKSSVIVDKVDLLSAIVVLQSQFVSELRFKRSDKVFRRTGIIDMFTLVSSRIA
jgi:hypothetical protein